MPRPCRFLVLVTALFTLAVLAGGFGAARTCLAADLDSIIAVLPFEINAGPELEYLNESLPELLGDRLSERGFPVVDQNKLYDLIMRQNVEYLDLATAKDVSLLAGANWAVYGSFSQVGETLSMDVRLVDAFGLNPARPIFVVKEGLINILPALDELAEKIANELHKKITIADIQVQGTQVLDKDVVLMRLSIQKGDEYDPAQLDRELKTIFDLGYFEDIRIDVEDLPQGKRVVFTVKEKPRIMAIDVKGADAIDQDDIIAALNTKVGGVLNLKVLSDDLSTVREMYRKDGYYLTKVDYEVEQQAAAQARLHIVVEEGNELFIEEIAINGAEQVDPDDLRSVMAMSERGWISWLTGSGVLQEEMLLHDASSMESYYADHGFMDARVAEPKVEFNEDGIRIVYTVEEGPRYTVGTIGFEGDLIESPETLIKMVELQELAEDDEWFNRSILRSDAQKLTEYYGDYGFAFAEVDFKIGKDKENHVIHVVFVPRKHEKMYIRRVLVEGNESSRDNVVRRSVLMADGDLYSGTKLRRSGIRLRKTGYFETSDIAVERTPDPTKLDLRVKVKEKSTGMIMGGIGYSSSTKIGIAGKVTESNLFGKGYFLGLSGSTTGSSDVSTLSFTNPHLYDTDLAVGGDVYASRNDYDDYDKDAYGGRLRFGYPLGDFTKLYWNYRLERYTIEEVDDDASTLIQQVEGKHWASTVTVKAVRDTTDSNIQPTTGTINELEFETGGGVLMGNDEFIKIQYESNYFTPVWFDHTFHWRGKLGFVFENYGGEDVPVFERFYLGGISNVRGYPNRKISPRDEDTNDRIGGNKQFFTNFEYLFPLSSDMGLMGLVFADAGNTWDEGDWDMIDLKKSAGGGIRWFSPMGIIRLETAYAFDEIEDQGSRIKFEFSMGNTF